MFVHCWNKFFLREIILDNKIKFDKKLTQLEDVNFNFQYLNYVKIVYCSKKYDYYHYIEQKSKSASGQAGTENNAIENCYVAFQPVRKYVVKNNFFENSKDVNSLLGHHFITTSIIYLIRLTRRYMENPSSSNYKYIKDWITSGYFKKNVKFYKLEDRESRLIYLALMSNSKIFIILSLVIRVVYLKIFK